MAAFARLFGAGGGVAFDPEKEIPDLKGKVVLVTGGNVGLGRESILQLCKKNPAQVFLAARNEAKAQEAIEAIKASVPTAAPIIYLPLDLCSFSSIKSAVETFNSQSSRLGILINNAGVMACPSDLTKEGYEIQFGTNHMGHALLTKLLLPTLQKTAKEAGSDVRIVNLSSIALQWVPRGGIVFSALKTDMNGYMTWTRYGQSKLANVLFNHALATRCPDIKCVAVHPGGVNTNLTTGAKSSYPMFARLIGSLTAFITVPVGEGAKNQLWASVSKDAKTKTLYYPIGKEVDGSQYAKDQKLSEELWEWTEKELKEHGF